MSPLMWVVLMFFFFFLYLILYVVVYFKVYGFFLSQSSSFTMVSFIFLIT